MATDYAGLARRLAPAMVAKLDEREALNKRLEGSDMPTGTPATPDESWRMSGGVQTRYNKARGGIETIENVQGTVKSGFTPYTPPAVSKDRPFADLLLTDIPKRMELVSRKLANGDIPGAQAERDRIEEFVRDNATDLHAFTRYTGDHPVVSAAAKQSLDLVTGGWLSDEQKLMFDPKLNPKSVQGWAARTGASPRLAEVMAAAQSGDETANAILRAAGSDFRTTIMPSMQPQAEQAGGRRAAMAPQEQAPINLDSFVRFSDSAIPAVMSGISQDALSPDDTAAMSRRLYTASSGLHPAAVGTLAKALSGVTPNDTPDMVKSKLSAGVDAASTVAGFVMQASPYAQSFLPAVSAAVSSIKGGSDRVMAPKDKLGEAVKRTMAAVDTSVASGAPVDQKAVERLTRIEYARAMSDVSFLDDQEKAISAGLQKTEALRRGLTISLDPTVPAQVVQNVNRDTGTVTQTQAGGELMYPGMSPIKTAMTDVLSYADADLAFGRETDLNQAVMKHKDLLSAQLVSPPDDPDAAPAAADMMLRYWTTEGQFDLRTSYEDAYRKYHVDINQASREDTEAKLSNKNTAEEVYKAADKAAVASIPAGAKVGFDAELYTFFSGRDPVNGVEVPESERLQLDGWDVVSSSSPQWKKAVDFTRGLSGRLVGKVTGATSTLGVSLAGMPIGRIMDEKQSNDIADELAVAMLTDMKAEAPNLVKAAGDTKIAKLARATVSHMLLNLRANPELRALAGQPDKTFGLAFPTKAEFNKVTASEAFPDLGPSAMVGLRSFGRSALANGITALFLSEATGAKSTYSDPLSLTGVASVAGFFADTNLLTAGLIKRTLPDSPVAAAVLSAVPKGMASVLRGISEAEPLQRSTMVTEAPSAGRGRKMRDFTVSLFGAPTVPEPPTVPVPPGGTATTQPPPKTLASLPEVLRRAALGEKVQLTAEQQDLLGSMSESALDSLRKEAQSRSGFVGGDAINWSIPGDKLASGMRVWEATANRAKAPVENAAVRSILANARTSPVVSHYVDTMVAVTDPSKLTRAMANKFVADAQKIAATADAARKTASAAQMAVFNTKLRDITRRRAGDGEGDSGTDDETFSEELDAALRSVPGASADGAPAAE